MNSKLYIATKITLVIVVIIGIVSSISYTNSQRVFYKDRIIGNYIFAGDIKYIDSKGDTSRYWVGYSFCTEYAFNKRTFPDSVKLEYKRNVFGKMLSVYDAFNYKEPSLLSDPNWEGVHSRFIPFTIGGK